MKSDQPYEPGPKTIFVVCCAAFLLSMFYRVSAAVISPELSAEFGLSGAELGRLSGAFFYAFAACQIPVGLALDRIGPRKTATALMVVAVAGSLVFAMAPDASTALWGRVLLGIGMSGNLMGPMALLANWFPVNRFGTLSGALVAVGSGGVLLASTPLALMTQWLGWRWSFVAMAVITALVGAAFFLIVRDRPAGASEPQRPSGNPLAGLGRLIRMPAFWSISQVAFVRYGALMAVQGLWLAPMIMYGLGLSVVQAGNALLAMGIGQMLGLPLFGFVSDRVLRSRKWVILPSLLAMTVFVAGLILLERGGALVWLLAISFFIGMSAGPGQIVYAHIKELVPPEQAGTAMTSINIFTMLGPAAMMEAVGWMMVGEPSTFTTAAQFHPAWWFLAGALLVSALLYAPAKDSEALKKPK